EATSRTVSRYDFTLRQAASPCTTGAPKFAGPAGMEREGRDRAGFDSRGKTTPRDAWGSRGNGSESTPKPKAATGSNPVAPATRFPRKGGSYGIVMPCRSPYPGMRCAQLIVDTARFGSGAIASSAAP